LPRPDDHPHLKRDARQQWQRSRKAGGKFFMNKFRKLGFIEYNGKLEVHKSLLNMVLHEKPEIKERDEAIGAD